MKVRMFKLLAVLMVAMMCVGMGAMAEGAISTTVVMRVSHMTQNAVVPAGEDFSIDVSVDGVEPDSYQWFFEGNPIEGADQKVLNLINAQPGDTGLYRMDAFDADGNMLVSMDFSVRVPEAVVPQSGDDSIPVSFAFMGIALCAAIMLILLRRRNMA